MLAHACMHAAGQILFPLEEEDGRKTRHWLLVGERWVMRFEARERERETERESEGEGEGRLDCLRASTLLVGRAESFISRLGRKRAKQGS